MADVVTTWDEPAAPAVAPPVVKSWDQTVAGAAAPVLKSWDEPEKPGFMTTVQDMAMVYPAVEAAMHAVTALVGGFPAFLGGAVGTMFSEGKVVTPKAKEVGSEFSEAVTYQPRTERGKRLAGVVMYPFQKITEWGEGAGQKVADVTGSAPLGALTEATVQMAVPVAGGKAIAKAAGSVKGDFKRPEELTGADKPIELEPPPSTTGTSSGVPLKLDALIAAAQREAQGIQTPPRNLAAMADRQHPTAGTSTGTPLPMDKLIAEAQRAGEGIPEPPRNLADLASRPGSPQDALALEGGQSRASGARAQSRASGARAQSGAEPEGAGTVPRGTSEQAYTALDPNRVDQIGDTRVIRSETLEGGVAGGRAAKVNQVLSWLEPEKGRGRADVDATIFDAGREYEKPETKQKAFNDLYNTFDQEPGLRAEYPEFYTERGQVDKRAVDAVARSYNTYVSTQMNAARRANEGKDTAIHPGSFDDFRGRGGRGAPPEAAPEAPPGPLSDHYPPAPGSPAGEIPPPPRERAPGAGRAPESLLSAIREIGGVNMREIRDLTGEGRTGRAGVQPGVFRTPGASADVGLKDRGYGLDDLIPRLRERGFNIADDPVDGGVQALRDMIQKELAGEKVYGDDAGRALEREQARRQAMDEQNEAYQKTKPYEDADRLYGRESEISRPPVEESPIASAAEMREPMRDEPRGMSDSEALDRYGPGTLGMNPMFDPAAWKDTLKPVVAANEAGKKMMNSAQAMPESAYPAAAAGYDFAVSNRSAHYIAQTDRARGYKDRAGIERDYKESLAEVKKLDPKYDPGPVATVKEASAAAERAKIRTATLELQKELLTSGVGVLPGKATSLDGYTKPTNYAAFTTPGGRTMYLRNDAAPVLEQMVSGYDWLHERKYMKSIGGKIEQTAHGLSGLLLAIPTFHMVTAGGRIAPAAINLPKNNLLRFGASAKRAMNDRAEMKDMMEHGVVFWPRRGTMEPSGAKQGFIEKGLREHGLGGAYDGYQWFHNDVLGGAVNWMATSYYQWRLNQLTSDHKGHMPAGTLETYKTMAGRDASLAVANLAKEEGNRSWFRLLGSAAFSRGLQVSTVRMATRALEGDKVLEAVARKNGMTVEQAKEVVSKNKTFLAKQLAKDYVAMVAIANAINYMITSNVDEPNGKKGGHFVWENQGSNKTQMILPTNIFVGTKTKADGTKDGIYMSTPFRSARDVVEYMMLPFEIATGDKLKLLKNKMSVPLKVAQETLQGEDWAGRPLGGTAGAAQNLVTHMTPSPFEDIPRYAMEAWAQQNPTYFSQGLGKVFDPATFGLKVAGMQPKIPKPDPETTMLQTKQLQSEEKVRARASKLKADLYGMSADTRASAIESVMDDAEKAGMDAKGKLSLRRYLASEGVARGATKAANRRLAAHPDERKDQLSAPPAYD